jgi:hypothetical protein
MKRSKLIFGVYSNIKTREPDETSLKLFSDELEKHCISTLGKGKLKILMFPLLSSPSRTHQAADAEPCNSMMKHSATETSLLSFKLSILHVLKLLQEYDYPLIGS